MSMLFANWGVFGVLFFLCVLYDLLSSRKELAQWEGCLAKEDWDWCYQGVPFTGMCFAPPALLAASDAYDYLEYQPGFTVILN